MFLVKEKDITKSISNLQFGYNIFITVIFVLFFGYFFKNMFLEKTITPNNILINTALFMIWYTLSLLY